MSLTFSAKNISPGIVKGSLNKTFIAKLSGGRRLPQAGIKRMEEQMKVLLIDDSAEIVESVSLCFELRWPEVDFISADEGGRGIELVKAESPDIIVLDLGLPDIDGLDVLEQIRFFSDVPVIILSVRGGEVDMGRGMELGANDYIVKPFNPTDLLTRVKDVLRRANVL